MCLHPYKMSYFFSDLRENIEKYSCDWEEEIPLYVVKLFTKSFKK